MNPDDCIDDLTAHGPYETPELYLLEMSKNLRHAQKEHVRDRGNEEKGAAVGEAAQKLDLAIEVAEPYILANVMGDFNVGDK